MNAQVTRLIQPLDAGEPTLHQVVAQNVGAILGANHLTRATLARAIGLSGPGLSMKLNGQRSIDLADLEAISTALGVEPSALLVRRSPRPAGPAGASSAVLPQMDSNHQPSD